MAYSMDLRLRILAALDEGATVTAVAARFQVSQDTVRGYRRRREQTGNVQPFKTGPKEPTKITPDDDKKMRELIDADAGITLKAIRQHLSVEVAESTVSRRLTQLGISLKKKV